MNQLDQILDKHMRKTIQKVAPIIKEGITPGWTGYLRNSIEYNGIASQDFANGFELEWNVGSLREQEYLKVNNEFHSANGDVPEPKVENIETKRVKGRGIPPRKFVEKSARYIRENL